MEQLRPTDGQAAASEADRAEFLKEVGRHTEENPDRPDIVQQKLGLNPSLLREMGYTRLGELQKEAAPVYAEHKAKQLAEEKEATYQARKEQQRTDLDAAWEKNKAYAEKKKQEKLAAEADELVASASRDEVAALTSTDLAELTGEKYSDILKNGKQDTVNRAAARVEERKQREKDAKTFVVPTNKAAEERASELGRLLKEHDREMFAGAQQEDPERKALKEAIGNMETRDLIKEWAKAEISGDDEIAKLVQSEIQDQIDKAVKDGRITEADIAKFKDSIQKLKDDEKSRLTEKPRQELYDYEEMIKEPLEETKAPSTELVPVSMGEDAAEDQKITLRGRVRDRFTRIKNSVALAPAKFMNRSPEDREPMSKRKKALWGIGATAVVLGAGYGLYKFGVDSGGSDSSLTVDPADLMGGPQVDTAPDTNAIDAINNAIDSRTQEIADTEGLRPWNVAYDLYGDQATERIIEAVNDMQADGIDIQWSADPLTDNSAYLTLNGINDTNYVVDQGLAEYLARRDVENFLQALETTS